MTFSPTTVELIKTFEEFRPEALQLAAGSWRIGYGHGGRHARMGASASEQEATEILLEDLHHIAEQVEKLLLPRAASELNENMFGALCSFALNLGLKALQESTVLRFVNLRQYATAADEFVIWNRGQSGRVHLLSSRRRQAEKNLFCGYPNPHLVRQG